MDRLVLLLTVLVSYGTFGAVVKRQAAVPTFYREKVGTVTSGSITEASGLAASRKHPGILYTHNDSGAGAHIYAISAVSGHRYATFTLIGATSNDWEDIAIGRCSSGFCIYIADTGDGGNGAVNNIYRIPEPDIVTDQTIHVPAADMLKFSWNQADCETLMVDPAENVYIVSKVDNAQSTIAQLPSSAWGNSRVAISSTAMINIQSTKRDPVGGDISLDGTQVLIKAKHAIYYWSTQGTTTDYVSLLQLPGIQVLYIDDEPQGESVCWDATDLGYYTLSEGHNEPLYHYVRNGN